MADGDVIEPQQQAAQGKSQGKIPVDKENVLGTMTAGNHQFTIIGLNNSPEYKSFGFIANNMKEWSDSGVKHIFIDYYLKPKSFIKEKYPELKDVNTIEDFEKFIEEVGKDVNKSFLDKVAQFQQENSDISEEEIKKQITKEFQEELKEDLNALRMYKIQIALEQWDKKDPKFKKDFFEENKNLFKKEVFIFDDDLDEDEKLKIDLIAKVIVDARKNGIKLHFSQTDPDKSKEQAQAIINQAHGEKSVVMWDFKNLKGNDPKKSLDEHIKDQLKNAGLDGKQQVHCANIYESKDEGHKLRKKLKINEPDIEVFIKESEIKVTGSGSKYFRNLSSNEKQEQLVIIKDEIEKEHSDPQKYRDRLDKITAEFKRNADEVCIPLNYGVAVAKNRQYMKPDAATKIDEKMLTAIGLTMEIPTGRRILKVIQSHNEIACFDKNLGSLGLYRGSLNAVWFQDVHESDPNLSGTGLMTFYEELQHADQNQVRNVLSPDSYTATASKDKKGVKLWSLAVEADAKVEAALMIMEHSEMGNDDMRQSILDNLTKEPDSTVFEQVNAVYEKYYDKGVGWIRQHPELLRPAFEAFFKSEDRINIYANQFLLEMKKLQKDDKQAYEAVENPKKNYFTIEQFNKTFGKRYGYEYKDHDEIIKLLPENTKFSQFVNGKYDPSMYVDAYPVPETKKSPQNDKISKLQSGVLTGEFNEEKRPSEPSSQTPVQSFQIRPGNN